MLLWHFGSSTMNTSKVISEAFLIRRHRERFTHWSIVRRKTKK